MSYSDFNQELHSQSFISDEINFKQVENVLAYQKDVEYMKQLLPSALQIVQTEIDEECDKLEYSGSVMFDEYPDKTHVRMIVDKIMHRLSSEEEEDGEVQGASLSINSNISEAPSYCPDDAMLDCEDVSDYEDVTEVQAQGGPGPINESWGRGPGWRGPGWRGPGRRGPGWGPPPPGPWRPRPCFGPLCPITNRRCGAGRWCPPFPFADYDNSGNPNWMKHLVENMLVNEMTYRRSRYRNHNL